jgi:hypothetical protein
MNKERLLNVAKALRESEKPDEFDMGTYVHMCGTPACALGHYAARIDLQDQFRIKERGKNMFGTQMEPAIRDEKTGDWVEYDDETVMDHFEISDAEAEVLFGPPSSTWEDDDRLADNAKNPTEAAAFIENFVNAREATR